MTFSAASTLLGQPVQDIDGNIVGQISDLLLDPANGDVAYLSFVLFGDSKTASRRLTVPWSAIRLGDDQTPVHIAVKRATLLDLAASGGRSAPR